MDQKRSTRFFDCQKFLSLLRLAGAMQSLCRSGSAVFGFPSLLGQGPRPDATHRRPKKALRSRRATGCPSSRTLKRGRRPSIPTYYIRDHTCIQSIHPSMHRSKDRCRCRSIGLSLCLSIYLSVQKYVQPYVLIYAHLPLSLCTYACIFLWPPLAGRDSDEWPSSGKA